MRMHTIKLASLAVMTAAIGAGPAYAKQAPRAHAAPAAAENYADPAAVRDSLGRLPYAVSLTNENVAPGCIVSREEIPVVGGGLQWRKITDCLKDY